MVAWANEIFSFLQYALRTPISVIPKKLLSNALLIDKLIASIILYNFAAIPYEAKANISP